MRNENRCAIIFPSTILKFLGGFKEELGREDIFKPTIDIRVYIRIVMRAVLQ